MKILFVVFLCLCGCTNSIVGTSPNANDTSKYPFRIAEVLPNPSGSDPELVIFKNVSSETQTSFQGWYFVIASTKNIVKTSSRLLSIQPLSPNATAKHILVTNLGSYNWLGNTDTLRLYDSLNTLVQTVSWKDAQVDAKIVFN